MEPETVRELYGAFEKFSLANVGAALTDEELDGMYRRFAPKVGGDVIDRLMRGYKAVVRGDAA